MDLTFHSEVLPLAVESKKRLVLIKLQPPIGKDSFGLNWSSSLITVNGSVLHLYKQNNKLEKNYEIVVNDTGVISGVKKWFAGSSTSTRHQIALFTFCLSHSILEGQILSPSSLASQSDPFEGQALWIIQLMCNVSNENNKINKINKINSKIIDNDIFKQSSFLNSSSVDLSFEIQKKSSKNVLDENLNNKNIQALRLPVLLKFGFSKQTDAVEWYKFLDSSCKKSSIVPIDVSPVPILPFHLINLSKNQKNDQINVDGKSISLSREDWISILKIIRFSIRQKTNRFCENSKNNKNKYLIQSVFRSDSPKITSGFISNIPKSFLKFKKWNNEIIDELQNSDGNGNWGCMEVDLSSSSILNKYKKIIKNKIENSNLNAFGNLYHIEIILKSNSNKESVALFLLTTRINTKLLNSDIINWPNKYLEGSFGFQKTQNDDCSIEFAFEFDEESQNSKNEKLKSQIGANEDNNKILWIYFQISDRVSSSGCVINAAVQTNCSDDKMLESHLSLFCHFILSEINKKLSSENETTNKNDKIKINRFLDDSAVLKQFLLANPSAANDVYRKEIFPLRELLNTNILSDQMLFAALNASQWDKITASLRLRQYFEWRHATGFNSLLSSDVSDDLNMKYVLKTGWKDRLGRSIIFLDIRRCFLICQNILKGFSNCEKSISIHPDRMLCFLLISQLEFQSASYFEDNNKNQLKNKNDDKLNNNNKIIVPNPRSKLWPSVMSISLVVDCRGIDSSHFELNDVLNLLISNLMDIIVLSQTFFFEKLGLMIIWASCSEIQFLWNSLLSKFVSPSTLKKIIFCSHRDEIDLLLGSDFVNSYS